MHAVGRVLTFVLIAPADEVEGGTDDDTPGVFAPDRGVGKAFPCVAGRIVDPGPAGRAPTNLVVGFVTAGEESSDNIDLAAVGRHGYAADARVRTIVYPR